MKKLGTKGFTAVEGLLIIILAVLIVGAGWWISNRKNSPTNITGISSKPTTYFYYTQSPDKVISYNLVNKKENTTKITLDDERLLSTASGGQNNSVQISGNGQKIYYMSIKGKSGSIPGGEGEPVPDKLYLSVFQGGKETKILEIDTESGQGIADWVINPNGSTIYYILQAPIKGKLSLHKLDVATKQDTTLKINLGEPGSINNPMLITPENTLLIYSDDGGNWLTEYKVDSAGNFSRRALKSPCDCALRLLAVSPDGSKLLLEESTSSTDPSNFTYYSYDLQSGKKTQFAKPSTNTTLDPIWSPKGDNIFYSTSSFLNADSFKQDAEIINVKSKKTKSIVTDIDSAKSRLYPLSWSPDGRYIAYYQGKIKFYDTTSSQILPDSINSVELEEAVPQTGWY